MTALLLLLAACGFRPLYGERGPEGASMPVELASIRVLPIADRPGQRLYNQLVEELSPYGRPGDPAYLLHVGLTIRTEQVVFRRDETATRANVNVVGRFELRRAADEKVVYSGTGLSTSSYDILENPFATLVSRDDAIDRATSDLGEEIRTRLAVYLSSTVADAP